MDLPDDVEILFMDDGSDPPLELPEVVPKNFQLIPTNDFRPWTSSLARNRASKIARGSYFLMTDGDYILTKQAIEGARKFDEDRLGFRREFGVLDADGNLTQDHDVLLAYGLVPSRLKEKGTKLPPHPNNFVMRAGLFHELGGYREDLILGREYPQKEDSRFKRDLMRAIAKGKAVRSGQQRPTIYMFPNGQFCGDVDYNPFGLMHTLSRKTEGNHWYHHPRYIREA
jgi:hypothetical protein